MEQNGWYFDPNYPVQELSCSSKIGEVTAQFQGFGFGQLTYRSCNGGKIEVFVNDVLLTTIDIGIAGYIELLKVEFDFTPYTKLKIKEIDDKSILNLRSLDLGCRGNKSNWFLPYLG